jgi:RNA polymerase sigma-70 factor (ECF subfamily)
MINKSDKKLIDGLRCGDADGCRALYDAYGKRVMGFALRLTGSISDAEDLTQETFIAAYCGRASFRGDSRPIAWLLGICSRRWRDKIRCCQIETLRYTENDAETGRHGAAWQISKSLEATVTESLTLNAALSELGEMERCAVLLVVSQGLGYKEAAAAMNEPDGTVKWRVSTALRKLQKLMLKDDIEWKGGPDNHGMQKIIL